MRILPSLSRNDEEVRSLTPRKVVAELDRFVIGQQRAKRAVAIALRNRWRRQQVEGDLRDEISPKNIIMVGPTGVGKTEIARRLAKLSNAPFVKVEVSKFTEVGYVGRDVDSVIRDLVEVAAKLVREEKESEVWEAARQRADEKILDALLPPSPGGGSGSGSGSGAGTHGYTQRPGDPPKQKPANEASREKLRKLLEEGKLEQREIEIEVEEEGGGLQMLPGMGPGMGGPGGVGGPGMGGMGGPGGFDGGQLGEQLGELFGGLGKRKRKHNTTVAEARDLIAQQEARKLVDRDEVRREAVRRAEQLGVVFLDEIDKICSRESGRGADVSREGVQRDLLPLVEGSTVATKYGPVRSDHVLFIAAGAFHMAKVSDLIPELQGRFPIRVELESLGEQEFVQILRDTDNSLIKQYEALLATEGVIVEFGDDAVAELARVAAAANDQLENIGARRLHTVLERVLDELSFEASEIGAQTVKITAGYVRERIGDLLADQDLSRHIL
ncbi:ATP-dependent protease ATPase subunit HslU [Pseudenhygromyxa sp. WMMC2535]|uniref:ATP-dependent protease ATPase subunit HslU n=1 Tax=Pseudenhygromyxa sp. WMMC2535 TaxID=2712867 RepID=UPI001552C75B|nr:ATP-dependent protease ATPase subunit HslU [Pseudenhygromyxa sp. WMMC2535]NVB42020.1 ATP-dependent protease ATPase subunit HslU [Pseudenhygromyxa sp. WMMC2535]